MDTFFDFNLMVPAEGMELADVGELAHGAVGLGGVEGQFAFESDFFHNQLGKGCDGNLFACADVDVAIAYFATTCLVSVLEINVFKYIDTGICHLFTPQEFTQRFACTPQTHFVRKDAVLGKYAGGNKVIRQLVDLALLQNNMLKGEALTNFVKRSIEMI